MCTHLSVGGNVGITDMITDPQHRGKPETVDCTIGKLGNNDEQKDFCLDDLLGTTGSQSPAKYFGISSKMRIFAKDGHIYWTWDNGGLGL